MCGIAGIVALPGARPPDERTLVAMARTLVHRGPDDEGSWVSVRAGLAMRRLSVIDLAGGHQPMASEDGSVHVVCNGEIYNFRELRSELEGHGHRFATHSDVEVIVHGYEQWGASLAPRLNGMFAFAVWDERRGRLVLGRDPVGIKPLFWARAGDHLVFGSEIAALLRSGLVPRELDGDALAELLCWEYVPAPATLLRHVHKLPGGCVLVLEGERSEPVLTRYWDVPETAEQREVPEEAWIERVDAALHSSVQSQLVADVPLGAFLSGGVDSSLVAAHMGELDAFAIGFDDPSYDELPWARRVARHLGVPLHEQIIRPDVTALFEPLMERLDDPIGDFSIFPTYLVSRLARERVTVALSGDGGDELFGGYETYLAEGWWRAYRWLPRSLRRGALEPLVRSLPPQPEKKGWINKARRFAEGAALEPVLGHTRWRAFAGEGLLGILLTPEAGGARTRPLSAHVAALQQRAGARDPVNRALYVDLHSYLADDILVKVDRMSMATSLEARVPYLDPHLIELAFSIPGRLKVARGRTKRLLKQVALRRVPAECVLRPKQGFSVPVKRWLGEDLRPALDDLLGERRLREQGLFDPAVISRLCDEHFAGRENHSHLLWAAMVFQAWHRRWIERPAAAAGC